MLRYYIERDGKRCHVYMEYDMGIKWIATLTDFIMATWLTNHLNNTQGNYSGAFITVASPEREEEINK